MASAEQIDVLMEQLKKAPPAECFQNFDMSTVGIRAILKILNETDSKVTAGDLSEHMKVSTARIAVLLKKMEAKGLIEKEHDSADGRVVVIKLSNRGKELADKFKANLYAHIGEMIDKIGMDRMLEFAAVSNEIQSLMKKSHPKPDI